MWLHLCFDGDANGFATRSGRCCAGAVLGVPVCVCVIMAVIMTAAWSVYMTFFVAILVAFGMAMPVVMSVSMTVAASRIRATFWFERCRLFGHGQVHRAQHVGQHVVGLNLQMIGFQLDLNVSVAQVVSRTCQVKRAAMCATWRDHQHRLRRGFDANQRAIFGHQDIASANHGSARKKHTQGAGLAVLGIKAAFLANVPVEGDGCRAFDQHGGQSLALRNQFVDGQHGGIEKAVPNVSTKCTHMHHIEALLDFAAVMKPSIYLVDVDRPETWSRYKKGMCDRCMASCCTMPLEVRLSDLVRLELVDAFEAEHEDIKQIAKRLTKMGIVERFNNKYELFTVARRASGDCRFLDAESRRCTVYDKRPMTCRSHPEKVGARPGYCAFRSKELFQQKKFED